MPSPIIAALKYMVRPDERKEQKWGILRVDGSRIQFGNCTVAKNGNSFATGRISYFIM